MKTLTKQAVNLVAAAIWGAYALITGTIAILFGYHDYLYWWSVITAVSANSVHLVTFSLSKNGASETTTSP